jgi:membrane protease YdiL (CAAX protease family)
MNRTLALILRLIGGQLAMLLATGVVFGAFLLFGLAPLIYDDYVVRSAADVCLAVVISVFVVLYANSVGGVRSREFLLGWNRRDTVFTAIMAVLILGAAAAYVLLVRGAGAHPLTIAVPALPVLLVGIVGESGVIHEEVLARGFFLKLLNKHTGIVAAILISAALFSLGHAIFKKPDFMLVGHFMAGIAFGYAYVKSGTLLIPIVMHVLDNLSADLFIQGDNEGVSLGMGLFQFPAHLGAAERLPYDVVLMVLELVVVWAVYSRKQPLLQPHARWLAAASAADNANARRKPATV